LLGVRPLKSLPIRLLLIVGVAATGLAAYGAYVSLPRNAPQVRTVMEVARKAVSTRTTRTRPAPLPASQAGGNYYGREIRQNLFNAPDPIVASAHGVAAGSVVHRFVVPPMPPADPLADTVYAGSVTVDGQTTALIESRSTREGDYVAAGGQWRNFQVVSVSREELTLDVNGVTRSLPVSDTMNIVPLTASAPVSTAQKSGATPIPPDSGATAKAMRAAVRTAEKQRRKKEKAAQALDEELGIKGSL
jgi:hypothetical protein